MMLLIELEIAHRRYAAVSIRYRRRCQPVALPVEPSHTKFKYPARNVDL
jgi:hypothetical protein